MKWTSLNDLRRMYLAFFESKGHTVMPSAPLIPQNDPSLLLINAGMTPFKNYFLGLEEPPNHRLASCQKCIRTPDIERVGKTARHGTYFEMLGNFSIGDYFKREATAWAWEFCTKVLELPADKIWVTVFENDDEAYNIWSKGVGISEDRIVRLGRDDNFWEIGSGPCGPCSELYFDRGESFGCGSPDCKPGCDCDRFMEFWNLVFTQFDSDGQGNYTPLEKPNIDTGMGLERMACIMQNVENLFEVDTVQNIMKHVSSIAGINYKDNAKNDISLRVITDHIRSTTFMINDGVVPSNEGRGYVLRRLLRRAARHGRLIGITEPFLFKVCDSVIAENEEAYPELSDNRSYIIKVIKIEEERFAKTIEQGMEMLSGIIEKLEEKSDKVMPGDMAFKLYDTFGFPIDLTMEILSERGITVDEEAFSDLMREQRMRARAAHMSAGDFGWEEDTLSDITERTAFVGYNLRKVTARIVAILVDNERTDSITAEQHGAIVLDTTPFYAESGGQVGDIGTIVADGHVFDVTDCKKSASGQSLHIGVVKAGKFSAGDTVDVLVNVHHRRAVMRGHSAAHLLHHALRAVLGEHVHQAGSYINENECRFDFTHFSSVSASELVRVEYIVNELILAALPVMVSEMSMDAAKELGATALFGEKYGDSVRVVDMGGLVIELCGGTHVQNTSQIGLFKIRKESSVAAGIRRIEAVTGRGVMRYINFLEDRIEHVAEKLKTGSGADILARASSIMGEMRDMEADISMLRDKIATMQLQGLIDSAEIVNGVYVIADSFKDLNVDMLKVMGDRLRSMNKPVAAVISGENDGKATLLAVCSGARGIKAGDVIKAVTKPFGGSGGGRAESAMGSIPDASKLQELNISAKDILREMLSNIE